MIPIAEPDIGKQEIEAVVRVIRSGSLGQGQKVEEFEKLFADYIGVKHAVSVNSGTAALYLALVAHGIGQGDEVVTSPFTFIATANAVLYAGARPVFVDISESDFNINIDKISQKITRRTKAIIPVHLYGQPVDMELLMKVATKHNLIIIEDASQAPGAEFSGRRVGSFGTGIFSFYATKNMTTAEGGMITTNDERIAQKVKMLRNHGSLQNSAYESLGFNFRMTEINACLGIEQLKKLDGYNARRLSNAQYLNERLRAIASILTPKIFPHRKHVFHLYTIRLKKEFRRSREEVIKFLQDKGIDARIYYPIPIHQQPLYKNLGYQDKLPISEGIAQEVLSLPVHPLVTQENLHYIVNSLEQLRCASV